VETTDRRNDDEPFPFTGGSLVEFLSLAFKPIPAARDAWEWVTLMLLLTGIAFAPPARVSQWFENSRWYLILGILALLFLWAGLRLMSERISRQTPQITLTPRASTRPGWAARVGGVDFNDNTELWVTIANHGPTAKFLAHVRDFTGARRDDGTDVEVEEVAWEHDVDKLYQIERGSTARLRLGVVSTNPVGMWFWTAQTYTWGARAQHAAGYRLFDLDHDITFNLEVYDVTHDLMVVARAHLTLSDGYEVEDFSLTVQE
jgi:hypothetical protein